MVNTFLGAPLAYLGRRAHEGMAGTRVKLSEESLRNLLHNLFGHLVYIVNIYYGISKETQTLVSYSYTAKVKLPPPKEEEKRLQKAIDMNDTALQSYRDGPSEFHMQHNIQNIVYKLINQFMKPMQ